MANELLFAVIETRLPYRPNDPGVVTWTGFPTIEASVELQRLTADPLTSIVCTTSDEGFAKRAWAISVNPEASAMAKRDQLIGDGISEEVAMDQAAVVFDYLRGVKTEAARELLQSALRQ